MRIFTRILTLVVLAISSIAATQAETNDKGAAIVYAFAFGTSFNDSTAYVSTVQAIPQASIDAKTKFLVYREEYAKQFKRYLEQHYTAHQTCAVVFNTNRKAVEKEFLKVRKALKKDKATKLVELEAGSFAFAPIVFESEE